jgi:exo-beta-1,3-glucanase (GH17 family)
LLTIFSAGFAREYNQLSPRAGDYGFNGVAYHGYSNDGNCKTKDQVASDLLSIASSGYSLVRLYGLDCNQVANTLAAAETFGIKLFVLKP